MRKLPVPVVKSTSVASAAPAVSSSPSKFERLFLSRGFDEAAAVAGPREGSVSRAAERVVGQQPMRPRDIPVTAIGSLMPPPPTQPQPLTAGQVIPPPLDKLDSGYVRVKRAMDHK